ncbi:Transcriptional adapter ada2 [Boothiomyces sp. JEL0866]|nr:Transcriptional adapter ada2 [Boothiomyces sp. JEL0866]
MIRNIVKRCVGKVNRFSIQQSPVVTRLNMHFNQFSTDILNTPSHAEPTNNPTNLPIKKISDGWDDSYLPDFDVILPKSRIESHPDRLVLELLKSKNHDEIFAKAEIIPDINGFNYWIENADFKFMEDIVKRMLAEEIRPNSSTFQLLANRIRNSGIDIPAMIELCSRLGISLNAEFYMVLVNNLYIQQVDALQGIPLDNRSDRKVFATLKFDKDYVDKVFSKSVLVALLKNYKDSPKQLIVLYNMLLAIHTNPVPAYLKVNSAQYMIKNAIRIHIFQDLIKEINKSIAIPNLATLELAAVNSLNLMDLEHCGKLLETMDTKKMPYNQDLFCRYFVAYLLVNEYEQSYSALERIIDLNLTPPENAIIRQLLACLVYNIPTDYIDQIHKKYNLTIKLNTVLKKKLLVNDNLIAYRLYTWMHSHGYKISPNAQKVLEQRILELRSNRATLLYLKDVLDFPIFESDWGADEELLLVEGLEMFGIGNWEHISEHIGTKNSKECNDHYQRVYINAESWPYPDMSEKFDMSPGKRLRARPPGYQVTKLPKCPRAPASQPVNHEIAGYMPGRKEFEHEFENDAEQIVKDIEITDEDTKEEIGKSNLTLDLKATVLDIYNTTLDRRAQRKKFVFDRGLTDFKKIQSIEKKRPKEEKELYQKYRVFAKMMTQEDFHIFMEGLTNELKLRQKINQLQEYIRMGVTTMKEANEYEKDKQSRINSKAAGYMTHIERSALRRSSSKLDDVSLSKIVTSNSCTTSASSINAPTQSFKRTRYYKSGRSRLT